MGKRPDAATLAEAAQRAAAATVPERRSPRLGRVQAGDGARPHAAGAGSGRRSGREGDSHGRSHKITRQGERHARTTRRSSRACSWSTCSARCFRLTGTHIGCDTTHCGACTVLLDGAAGEVVHGARGAGRRARGDDRRGAGAGRQAPSAPGRLLGGARAAVRLLHAGHADDQLRAAGAGTRIPSEDEIREAISGNLCRCTGYVNIVKAIQHAAAASSVGGDVTMPSPRTTPRGGRAWGTR